MLNRRHMLAAASALFLPVPLARAADWTATLAASKGQTVHFNAWAGSEPINAYIQWAAEEAERRFGFSVKHVKITDAAEVVKRVRDEVAAGKTNGSVDLIWINGENFRTMKTEKLLFGPFSASLPNYAFVDVAGKPSTTQDFSESVDGLESPWGMAQLTFCADGAALAKPPLNSRDLLARAQASPQRFTYPAPPDFHGTTFLKQVMLEQVGDAKALYHPAGADAGQIIGKVFTDYLDALHAVCWRGGKQFPKSQTDVTQMVADNALDIGLTFNPNEPANLVAAGRLPASTLAWQFSTGTIGNTHFVAIPVNATAPAAAQVFADFLLSPEAQARKADIKVWGDPTVLDVAKLAPAEQKLFTAAAAPGSVTLPGPTLLEPHASWVEKIESEWLARYGQG
ncbi:MAG: ABC transporter substrate-binding protein [Hyphomicrobiales bacterium]